MLKSVKKLSLVARPISSAESFYEAKNVILLKLFQAFNVVKTPRPSLQLIVWLAKPAA
jgi:hypothetical protein